ncbi:MAG: bifunctional adenosylcobinamide kinase/adenosylcobinamide-phosphate guanylyltransferase [Pseudomonadota bacterium]
MLDFPKLTLVLGGANSGKSAFAEGFAHQSGLPKTYLATAQAFDAEMARKIAAHQKMRADTNWTTIEKPLDIVGPITKANGVLLVDCLTLWLSNHLMTEAATEGLAADFLDAQSNSAAHVIAVSNEVGLGIVPDNKMARTFRAAQGRLNQEIAAKSDLVVNVVAGLPQVLKGTLP